MTYTRKSESSQETNFYCVNDVHMSLLFFYCENQTHNDVTHMSVFHYQEKVDEPLHLYMKITK